VCRECAAFFTSGQAQKSHRAVCDASLLQNVQDASGARDPESTVTNDSIASQKSAFVAKVATIIVGSIVKSFK
jgi:hypothetical protein